LEDGKTVKVLRLILGFRREVEDNCSFLGYCTASSGNFLPNP